MDLFCSVGKNILLMPFLEMSVVTRFAVRFGEIRVISPLLDDHASNLDYRWSMLGCPRRTVWQQWRERIGSCTCRLPTSYYMYYYYCTTTMSTQLGQIVNTNSLPLNTMLGAAIMHTIDVTTASNHRHHEETFAVSLFIIIFFVEKESPMTYHYKYIILTSTYCHCWC